MTLDPRAVARALGCNVSERNVVAPGPGHSRADRSLSIKIEPTAPDGFIPFVRRRLAARMPRLRASGAWPWRAGATAAFGGQTRGADKGSRHAHLRVLRQIFEPRRKDSKFCGGCKQHAYRQRVTDNGFPLRPESETPTVTGNGSEAPRWDKSRNGGEA
jgi:hypothetical protein